jgi:hypothetical protein
MRHGCVKRGTVERAEAVVNALLVGKDVLGLDANPF